MNKKAFLEETYNSAFKDELDKIAQDEYRYYCPECDYESDQGGICPQCGAMMVDSDSYDYTDDEEDDEGMEG